MPALEYRDSLGQSFEDAGPIRDDVEHLIGRLHQAAQDPDTGDELSLELTMHARDEHRLFYGSDDEPREIAPKPRMVYGWTVDASQLLDQASPPPEGIEPFVRQVIPNPAPAGLSNALNNVIDSHGDETLDEDDDDFEYVDPFVARLRPAFDGLVNSPGDTAAVIAYQFVLHRLGLTSGGAWVLAALLVLLQLTRRSDNQD